MRHAVDGGKAPGPAAPAGKRVCPASGNAPASGTAARERPAGGTNGRTALSPDHAGRVLRPTGPCHAGGTSDTRFRAAPVPAFPPYGMRNSPDFCAHTDARGGASRGRRRPAKDVQSGRNGRRSRSARGRRQRDGRRGKRLARPPAGAEPHGRPAGTGGRSVRAASAGSASMDGRAAGRGYAVRDDGGKGRRHGRQAARTTAAESAGAPHGKSMDARPLRQQEERP